VLSGLGPNGCAGPPHRRVRDHQGHFQGGGSLDQARDRQHRAAATPPTDRALSRSSPELHRWRSPSPGPVAARPQRCRLDSNPARRSKSPQVPIDVGWYRSVHHHVSVRLPSLVTLLESHPVLPGGGRPYKDQAHPEEETYVRIAEFARHWDPPHSWWCSPGACSRRKDDD
jgi:hypothetical protein